MVERHAILKLARTADATESKRILALDGCDRIRWAREHMPDLASSDDDLDEVLCIFLRSGTRKKRASESSDPAIQCKTCGVSIVTKWDMKTRKFVEPPHGCVTPWRFGSNLQHHGKAPEPSLDASVSALLLNAWSFTDYSPRVPNMTRKVVRVLEARTQALADLLELVEQLHPDVAEVRNARIAVELE